MSNIKKINNIKEEKPCNHPEHNPPTHIVLEPGTYEHIGPGCGKKTIFLCSTETFM